MWKQSVGMSVGTYHTLSRIVETSSSGNLLVVETIAVAILLMFYSCIKMHPRLLTDFNTILHHCLRHSPWRLSEKRGNLLKTTNMATASMSIAEELLGNIPMLNVVQLRALVLYLSPEDATTIKDFEQSELAEDHYVETINLRYGKLENKNHLFDIFSKYCGYDDSTYTRLDMLTFVAENTT